MKEKLIDIFEYTHYFNNEVIKVIAGNISNTDEKIISLINHTLNAQQIWNARILGEKTFDVWQINPFGNLEEINTSNHQKSTGIIRDSDFDQRIQYHNSKGTTFENSIFEMLFHAVNHSTYHRGQINMLMKSSGIDPVPADYIFYKR